MKLSKENGRWTSEVLAETNPEKGCQIKQSKHSVTEHYTACLCWITSFAYGISCQWFICCCCCLFAVVILSVVASGFFTILYSMQWGHEKSIDWLQTFLLSFVQNVLVVQPVKVSTRILLFGQWNRWGTMNRALEKKNFYLISEQLKIFCKC